MAVLEPVWQWLFRLPDWRQQWLQEAEAGSWLLRSLVQLAHALIDIGRWFSASRYLVAARGWLSDPATALSPAQRAYQDASPFASASPGATWRAISLDEPLPAGSEWVSLRTDDIWLETQQYLGIVWRDDRRQRGVAALCQAVAAFAPSRRREVLPSRRLNCHGVLEHDLGVGLSALGPAYETAASWHLAAARDLLLTAGNRGILAATLIALAHLEGRQAAAAGSDATARWRRIARMQDLLAQARQRAGAEPSPILRTTTAIDAAELLVAHGLGGEIGWASLVEASELSVREGYAHEAARLVRLPGLADHLPASLWHPLAFNLVASQRKTCVDSIAHDCNGH